MPQLDKKSIGPWHFQVPRRENAGNAFVYALHLAFILWVALGVFFTRGRLVLRRLHIISLVWGLLIEIFPWTCRAR
jgi:hypothetical protein